MKWQLGACGAFAVFLVFGSVQNSQAFQQAYAQKVGDSTSSSLSQQLEDEDAIVEDWAQRQPVGRTRQYSESRGNGSWSTEPEADSSESSGGSGMRSQTGRS
ncbi:hypothetical protein [Paenibacillus luteus]|uniref:hypothetical protein n=1 Tax=Paenibacillus luteus TaxID=2545753 RepID=UPI0019D5B311|nr:hypothetical protein [Paenibacillus luteus]